MTFWCATHRARTWQALVHAGGGGKVQEQADAVAFAVWLFSQPVPRIALENPVGVLSRHLGKPAQIIQPFQFGHPESKKTCLWLKNLPPLQLTNLLTLPPSGRWNNQTPTGQNKLTPSPDRWKLRSRTYDGIAEAMASQWSVQNIA